MTLPIQSIRTTDANYHIHMIGICGAGMSGIAEVLKHFGYLVSGSDIAANSATHRYLKQLGITVYDKHLANHVGNAQVVVYSSAISADNPELMYAKNHRIPCMRRAEMLADLIRYHYGIAIAGAHGKTTTTSLIQYIFLKSGMQPTHIAGARLLSQQSHASVGAGEYFIIEADESDASFTHIHPVVAVITNIDKDHMHTYQHNINTLHDHYLDFIHNTPFYGTVIACGDDPQLALLLPKVHRRIIRYGLNQDNDYYATDIETTRRGTRCLIHARNIQFVVNLTLFGKHNLRNTLGAIVTAMEQRIPITAIQQALIEFPGVSRRFNQYHCKLGNKQFLLIDDYGHHPNEIRATLESARTIYSNKPIVLTFQPHRYSRTFDLYDDFIEVLETADTLIICETYAAGEATIASADSQALCRGIRSRGHLDPIFAADVKAAFMRICKVVKDGDVVIVQGAGDIAKVVQQLITKSVIDDNS